MNYVIIILAGYAIIINLIGFCMMGVDKKRAIKRAFRIPEATLFTVAIVGGSIGSIIGMHLFRHKTRHWYFLYGMPAILVIQIILIILVITGPFNIVIL